MALHRWFKSKGREEPLIGAPVVPREKSYASQSGWVYRYFYLGHKPSGAEFIFEVSAASSHFRVCVIVAPETLEPWERGLGRTLTPTERYAVAKLALFQAFDASSSPEEITGTVRPAAEEVGEALEKLGIR